MRPASTLPERSPPTQKPGRQPLTVPAALRAGVAVRAVLELERIAGLVEGDALQRPGRDQAILGVVVGLGVVDDVVLRRTVIQHVAIDERALREPVATVRKADAVRARAHALFIVILDAPHDMQATVEEAAAGRESERRSFHRRHSW